MKKWIRQLVAMVRGLAPACTIGLLLFAPLPAYSQDDGPQQEVFLPKNPKGPIVVLISGNSGMASYRYYGSDVAGLGYYTILIDGKDILTTQQDGGQNLRKVIAKARASPNAIPGKIVVVGFSQGGGAVLRHAVIMPELIAAAVAYYPAISWSKDIGGTAAKIQIPLLVLAGERDRYNNCCLIESMRELETAAKKNKTPFELVAYPNADHGFNIYGRSFRSDDKDDAWRRTKEVLAKYLPLD